MALYLSLAATPQRLVETAFQELADRWLPILNSSTKTALTSATKFTLERTFMMGHRSRCFWMVVNGHSRCNLLYDPSHFVLQQLDYLSTSISITTASRCFM